MAYKLLALANQAIDMRIAGHTADSIQLYRDHATPVRAIDAMRAVAELALRLDSFRPDSPRYQAVLEILRVLADEP